MTIHDAIQAYLTSSPYPLPVGARVWYAMAPQQKSYPAPEYVVIYPISPRPVISHTGPAKLLRQTFQISVFSDKQRTAAAISATIRHMLNGKRGNMAGVYVGAALWTAGRGPTYEDGAQMYQSSDDYEFQFLEQ